MIFVTVGTQIGFDRLIKIIDSWALQNPGREIFAQIGNATYFPKNISYSKYLSPISYDELFHKAYLIVSHAGTGTIIKASLSNKLLIVFPRDYNLGEHRNNHQYGTVKSLEHKLQLNVAYNEQNLLTMLDNLNVLKMSNFISEYANESLLQLVKDFLKED